MSFSPSRSARSPFATASSSCSKVAPAKSRRMDQRAKAEAFRRFHLEPPILVLPNAWDVASAKKLAALSGCRALATTSAAVARSLGWEDGERAPATGMLQANERIAAAVEVPVTGDLERGYG